jgi:hypothetical protein
VAAVLACAGLAGAAGSLTGGFVIKHLPEEGLPFFFGSTLSAFRTVFLISAFFRLIGFVVSLRLHEPGSQSAPTVLMNVVRPAAIRWLQAPWLAVFRPGGENGRDSGRWPRTRR